MRRRALPKSVAGLIAVMAAMVGAAAGCGGGSSSTSPPSNASVPASVMSDYRATYQGIIAEYNRASAAFDRNRSLAKANVKPFVDAIRKSDTQLLAVQWPTAVEADVIALVAQDRVVTSDLSKANGSRFNLDAGKDALIATKVRTDLNFPPPGH
jgi:hypothetical protein